MASFSDRLAKAIQEKKSPLVVGLDPRTEQLPLALAPEDPTDIGQVAESYQAFCFGVIDAVADQVPAVKPQFAFFEQLGPAGMMALAAASDYAKEKGLIVVGDGKRGDIGSTAIAYASAYLGENTPWAMDSLTVNPYLGSDSLQPMVETALSNNAGIFFLVKTSNQGSGDLQDLSSGDLTIYQHVADRLNHMSRKWLEQKPEATGLTGISAVVGATYPEQLSDLRKRMPNSWILIPGFGAQGGTAADTAAGFLENGLGAIVNSSRGVIFAFDKEDASVNWTDAVRAAAQHANERLRSHTPAGNLSS